jgi:AcrR family transcriptional regulator
MKDQQPDLRERTRRAIQNEIVRAANALFVERGYAATTMEDIAAAVGMSQRSMFRYFPTKGDIVLGKLDIVTEEMMIALRERPADEPVWTSLRRAFDVIDLYATEAGELEIAEPMQRIVFGTPALFAGYLQKLQQMQGVAAAVLIERAEAQGCPYTADDPAPRSLAAAAFGCLVAAQHSRLASGAKGAFAEAIDRAMATVGPTSSARL